MSDVMRHGIDCVKAPHYLNGGHLHGVRHNGPYDVDGVTYCGRCHSWIELEVKPVKPAASLKVPRALSSGEECLALHLRANHIDFEREVCLIPGRKWRVDFYLKPALVVEVEGGTWQMGRHQRPGGFEADCAKYNALAIAGYSVLRFTTEMVLSGNAIATILPLVVKTV